MRKRRASARDKRAAGHTCGLASAVAFLGLLRLRQWRFADAYDCFGEAYNTARTLTDLAEIRWPPRSPPRHRR
ncbi:hypothetical protein ACIOML_16690 [Streptomyces anulatus]